MSVTIRVLPCICIIVALTGVTLAGNPCAFTFPSGDTVDLSPLRRNASQYVHSRVLSFCIQPLP
jgi:hypothetical protein